MRKLRRSLSLLAHMQGPTLVLTRGDHELFVDEDAEAVHALLVELGQPRERDELSIDDDTLAAFLDLGFIEEVEEAGARVQGDGPLAAAVTEAVPAGDDVRIIIANGWSDLAAIDDAAARFHRGERAWLVWGGNDVVYVGPFSTAGACPECAWMRTLGRRKAPQYGSMRRAVRDGWRAVPDVGVGEHGARLVSSVVAAALARNEHDEAVLAVDLETGTVTKHPLVSHPVCLACGRFPPRTQSTEALRAEQTEVAEGWPRRVNERELASQPAPELVARYRDPRTGLFYLQEEWAHRDGYFRKLPIVVGGIGLVRRWRRMTTGTQGVCGTGPTLEHRRIVALSESCERYAQHAITPHVTNMAARDLGDLAVDLDELTTFLPERYAEDAFPYLPPSRETPRWWSWGYSLTRQRARLLPHETIQLGLNDTNYRHRLFDRQISTGGASHLAVRPALVSAVREVLERDLAMVMWTKRIPLRRVETPTSIDGDVGDELLAFLDAAGVKITIFDLHLDLPVPALFIMGTRAETMGCWEAGGIVTGATVGRTAKDALVHALYEMALHYETQCLTPDWTKDWRTYPYDPKDPKQGWDAWWPLYLYYLNPAHAEAFDFVDDGSAPLRLDDIKPIDGDDELDGYLRALDGAGLEPWAFDVTTHDLAPLGFRVVKVVVPGTLDGAMGMQSLRLRSPRPDLVVQRLGRGLPPGRYNDDPPPIL